MTAVADRSALSPADANALLQGDGAQGGRVPPQDLVAEAAILSCLLLDPTEGLDDIGELKQEDFYAPANRAIFAAILELDQAHAPIDTVTVAGKLKDQGRLPSIGGVQYLAHIVDAAPAVANLKSYVDRVREKWRVRAVIAACQRASAEGYGKLEDAQAWVQSVEQAVFDLAHQGQPNELVDVRSVLRGVLQRQQDAAQRGITVLGQPTGFAKYDELISGLHPGELHIIAARPGMGKTSFALNIAVNIAAPRVDEGTKEQRPGKAALVFTLEMPRDQIAMRVLCAEARVDIGKFRRNRLTSEDWVSLNQAAGFIGQLPLFIDDTPAITLLEVRAKVRRKVRELEKTGLELGVVVIDYLQLMSSPSHASRSREQEVAVISKGLKQLSKEMKVPVIALSQLNRAVEGRGGGKRPQLSDLRESGSIEQDADAVTFVHRDDYYDKDSVLKGYAELCVEKQRNGPTGDVWVTWDSGSTRFGEPTFEDVQRIHQAMQEKAKANRKGGWTP